MTIPRELKEVLEQNPEILHGALRFRDTRVFTQQLFDYILSGDSLDDFLEDFPEVPRKNAEAVLEWERKRLRAQLAPRLSA